MLLNKDLREFAELLNSNKVEFVVVGAFAVGWHGFPRFTGDLDVLVRPTVANGAAVVEAIRQFGFASLGIADEDFAHTGRVIQLGFEPSRIDLVTSITGVDFEEIWVGKVSGEIDGLPVFFIGFDELLRNKEATG